MEYIRFSRPVVVGAAATAVLTGAFLAAPGAINFRAFQVGLFEMTNELIWFWDNPFPALQYLGGFGGGFVAGYLTEDGAIESFINGLQATILGLFVFYLLNLLFSVARVMVGGGVSSTLLLVLILQPLIFFVLPTALLYFFEGTISSVIGHTVRAAADVWFQRDDTEDGLLAQRAKKALLAILSFFIFGGVIWTVVFVVGEAF